ncbi:hypothetical protein [Actinomadura terrae]|uniref:hypothetical protein n=1 Tax=Actinomadura terrae TaxID=604353 RepID=UPI001FA79881|nr:hypothetical protein [Actinomadura terrae]
MKLRRAIVGLMSARGQPVTDIAHLLDCSPEYVRGVTHGGARPSIATAGSGTC